MNVQVGTSLALAGRYMAVPQMQGSYTLATSGGASMAAQDLALIPLWVPAGNTLGITKMALCNADAVADNFTVRLGIYEAGSTWLDSSLLIDAGTITKGATAATSFVVSSGSTFTSVPLGPSKAYLIAILCTVATSGASQGFVTSSRGDGTGRAMGFAAAWDPSGTGAEGWLYKAGMGTGALPSSVAAYADAQSASLSIRTPMVYLYVDTYS